jgi:hypothetical protein
MTIKGMHLDFKNKYNKVDSLQNTNFDVPQIDFILNQAAELFVKLIAQPRLKSHLGFEVVQRTIDDIRMLVINDKEINVVNNIAVLPTDYLFYLRAFCMVDKNDSNHISCKNKKCRVIIRQHDDMFDESPFDRSSFEWRFVNALFVKEGIKLFADDTMKIGKMKLSYLKKLDFFHNAEDYSEEGYETIDGVVLSGFKNCELPGHTHSEIVNIAVLLVSAWLNDPSHQFKQLGIKLDQIF